MTASLAHLTPTIPSSDPAAQPQKLVEKEIPGIIPEFELPKAEKPNENLKQASPRVVGGPATGTSAERK